MLSGALLLVALGGAFLAGWSLRLDPSREVSSVGDSPLTVPVVRGALQETVFASVELSFEQLAVVRGRGGTVTSRAENGSIVSEGDVLMTIDLGPIVLLRGEIPMFREIAEDTAGPDVAQIQDALHRWGFYEGDVQGIFDNATSDAWSAFLTTKGYTFDGTIVQDGIVFVKSVPARVMDSTVKIGDDASGDLVTLGSPTPTVLAYLPPGAEVSVGNSVEIILGSGVVETTVEETRDTPNGPVAELLPPAIQLGASSTLRARILGEPSSAGFVVPISALYSDGAGGSYVRHWRGADTVVDIPVKVIASSSTEAVVEGELQEGDELVVGQ